MAMHTATVDLPAQTTLDQAIVALLRLRRGDVPGDATLIQAASLQFEYARPTTAAGEGEDATPSGPDPAGSAFPPTATDSDTDGDGDGDGEEAGSSRPTILPTRRSGRAATT